MRRVAARTGNGPMFFVRRIELQRWCQSQGSSLMHGGTDNGFDRFQIQPTLAAAFLKNNAQKTIYFADDRALDFGGRFFPAASLQPAPLAANGRSAC
jgi:hypothetical protein